MRFLELASYFQKLENTASRLEITRILADLFQKSLPEEIDKICYLSLGRLAPAYAGIEFNLAEKLLVKAVSRTFAVDERKIIGEYKKTGDLGEVVYKFKAEESKEAKEKRKELSVPDVFRRLSEVAVEEGQGAVERKIGRMQRLLEDADALSAKFIVRIPLGKLRLGFSDLTIMDALSWMAVGDKTRREEIEEAYNVRADIGYIARVVRERGLAGLKGIKISLGTPIMPSLCQRLPTAEEMVEKMCPSPGDKVAVEPKYDGTRLQIHFSRKKKDSGLFNPEKNDGGLFDLGPKYFIRIFTRNLENVTAMFPDIAGAAVREIKAEEAILDGEAIGYDPQTGKFLPFQETIKRKRKYEVGEKMKEIPVKYFCFDILYKDGEDLIAVHFYRRRLLLEKTISSQDKRVIVLSPQIVATSAGELRRYHDQQVKKGLEGVVVKKWEAAYEPGRRGFTWVKFKQEISKKGGGLADTLDCVVMGYYRGRGKRAAFGIGGFLVGIREERGKGRLLTISKIGTGLSDEQWRKLRKISNKLRETEKPREYAVNKNLEPDVWCRPSLVVEIQADNITKSPVHTARYALRFPRLVRFRDDKRPDQATTLEEVENLYKMQ